MNDDGYTNNLDSCEVNQLQAKAHKLVDRLNKIFADINGSGCAVVNVKVEYQKTERFLNHPPPEIVLETKW